MKWEHICVGAHWTHGSPFYDFETPLTTYGRDGWELVAVLPPNDRTLCPMMFFKRQSRPEVNE